MMENYFKKKVGEVVEKRVTTGNDSYNEVYCRVYKIEIVKIE